MLSPDYYSVHFSCASSLAQRPHFQVLYNHVTGGIMPLSHQFKGNLNISAVQIAFSHVTFKPLFQYLCTYGEAASRK